MIDFNNFTATRKGVVGVKYARKQIQDELKAMGVYGSTVWYEYTEDDVMHFKITNPILELWRYISHD